MKSVRRRFPVALLLAFLTLAPAADALDLFVRGIRPGTAVFGRVDIEVEVLAETPVESVELFLDGVRIGKLAGPPYRFQVDVGHENRQRAFEIVARDTAGEEARRSILTPPIAIDLELDLALKQLYVTVTQNGRRVLDLDRRDFTLLDQGLPQEIVTFERGDVPLTAVLLLDTSFSMRGPPLAASLLGAQTFVSEMRPLDLAKVIAFSDRVLSASPFTGEPDAVAQAMEGLSAAGGSAVNDHLYLALGQLDLHQGRKVVVLLSDGVDVESILSMQQVLAKAQRSEALLYWIHPAEGKGKQHRSAWRSLEGHAREIELLSEAIEASGGRILELNRIEDAAATFQEILAELREQYVFGYYPTESRGGGTWRKVKIRTNASGTKVRARAGYRDAD